MTQKSELGAKGESAACLFLERKGYRIVERNARKPWGELDIVAQAPDGTLIFVEVKTISGSWADYSGAMPEDHMTAEKLHRFRRTASLYASHRHKLVRDDRGYRLDLIALTKTDRGFTARHYENV